MAISESPVVAQDSTGAADTTSDLLPAGFGTLRQEDISIRLQTRNLRIQIMPLDESIIRLLAPDTYETLRQLLQSRADEIAEEAERNVISAPSLFVVTFFSLQERAQFREDELTIQSRNRFFRPVATIPLSPTWSGQELNQRESTTAIYLFEEGIELLEPFQVSYADGPSGSWDRRLRTIERERARVEARAAAAERR